MATKEQVKEYYDTFKEHQKQLGINIRHRTIFKNLIYHQFEIRKQEQHDSFIKKCKLVLEEL